MIVNGAGEHLADVMTIPPYLAEIPSASAILDTSNYTFWAVSFGKDSAGYRYHAHYPFDPSSLKVIKARSYLSQTLSSYVGSATASALDFDYKLLPAYPHHDDTRLDPRSTQTNVCASIDFGQCANPIIDPATSALAHLIGCFPASGGTTYWIGTSSNVSGSLIFSGSLSSGYNRFGVMDSSGFLTFRDGSQATSITASQYLSGCTRYLGTGWPRNLTVAFVIPSGDAGALNLFGGCYNLGLWV